MCWTLMTLFLVYIEYHNRSNLALATMIGKFAFIRTPIKVLVFIMDMWLCDLICRHWDCLPEISWSSKVLDCGLISSSISSLVENWNSEGVYGGSWVMIIYKENNCHIKGNLWLKQFDVSYVIWILKLACWVDNHNKILSPTKRWSSFLYRLIVLSESFPSLEWLFSRCKSCGFHGLHFLFSIDCSYHTLFFWINVSSLNVNHHNSYNKL